MQFELPEKLVLFDGDCVFCNYAVQFLLKWNQKESLYFSSLNSELGKVVLENFHLKGDSIVYVMRENAYTHMDAVFLILDELPFWFQIFKIFKIFPRPFLNLMYKIFANHRYLFFGKRYECKVLPLEVQKRFL